ncbi:hypothetical protein MUK42_32236 [Musa troglodytarum]|uniref:Uncharacterized protein n=1 Tax=Musa troglodytarum TaxID=320322 RepID=A0A9E7JT95_9LILI|nr:hypothetical protein MUK42_32236 [Musa troglodytarum]
MALERARAEDTPVPAPDMSSPRRSFANFSFIDSISAKGSSKRNDSMTVSDQARCRSAGPPKRRRPFLNPGS